MRDGALIKWDCTEQIPLIGQSNGRHLEVLQTGHQGFQPDHTFQYAELASKVEMNEFWTGHGRIITISPNKPLTLRYGKLFPFFEPVGLSYIKIFHYREVSNILRRGSQVEKNVFRASAMPNSWATFSR